MVRRGLVVVVVVGAALLAACGGSGTPARSTGDSKSTTTTAAAAADAHRSGVESSAPVPSAGCTSAGTPATSLERRTLPVDGQERWYLVTAPATAQGAKPVPLVLDLHGLAEGASIHAQNTGFGDLAEQNGFVVVFPNGSGNPIGWDIRPTANNHDLHFIKALVDAVESQQCIDTSRVYATGFSYGALMSSLLACTMADTFAAVAPVSGFAVNKDCHPTRRLPVLTFHGTADQILPFSGGVGDLSGLMTMFSTGDSSAAKVPPTTTTVPADLKGKGYPATVAAWAKRNGCDPNPTETKVGTQTLRRTYHCPKGADVVFYVIVGGGHSWPGSEFSRAIGEIVGPTTFDVNASETIWEFFQRFHLPER